MGFIHEYFQKHGVDEKDVPSALLLYKGLGLGITIGTYALCYRYRPLHYGVQHYPLRNINNWAKTTYPQRYNQIETFVKTKTDTIANWKYFKPIPSFFGLDTKRASVAIGETLLVDKLTDPITVPFAFIATVSYMKNKNHTNNSKQLFKSSTDVYNNS